MMTDSLSTVGNKKMENKVTGFNVRILDDGTYFLRTENKNYNMCKEYSYENMDDLHKGMKQIMGKMEKYIDALSERY